MLHNYVGTLLSSLVFKYPYIVVPFGLGTSLSSVIFIYPYVVVPFWLIIIRQVIKK